MQASGVGGGGWEGWPALLLAQACARVGPPGAWRGQRAEPTPHSSRGCRLSIGTWRGEQLGTRHPHTPGLTGGGGDCRGGAGQEPSGAGARRA